VSDKSEVREESEGFILKWTLSLHIYSHNSDTSDVDFFKLSIVRPYFPQREKEMMMMIVLRIH